MATVATVERRMLIYGVSVASEVEKVVGIGVTQHPRDFMGKSSH